jgi:transmembrane sensor
MHHANGPSHQHMLKKRVDLVTLDQKGKLKKDRIRWPDAFATWKEHPFVFDETSVAEICTLLQGNFGVNVKPAIVSIGSRTITGNFQARSAEELLNGLREVLNLQIQSRYYSIILSAH